MGINVTAQKTEGVSDKGSRSSEAEIREMQWLRGAKNMTYSEIAKRLSRGYSTVYRHTKKEGVKRNFLAERKEEMLEVWQLFMAGKKLKEIVRETGLCKRTIRKRIVEHVELVLKDHPDVLSAILNAQKEVEGKYRTVGDDISNKKAMRSAILHYVWIARKEAESTKIEEMIKDGKTNEEIAQSMKKSSKTIYDRMGESIRRRSSSTTQQDAPWLMLKPLLRY